MNFIFISPQFPKTYWNFCDRLKKNGVNVLGIGDTPYDALDWQMKQAVNEYYYVDTLEDYDKVFRAVAYFSYKYGKIDWIESNNEYWLEQDARLRTDFNINTGVKAEDINRFKSKAAMKDYYYLAKVPTARQTKVQGFEEDKKFIDLVEYPVIVKPEIGVGAAATWKLNNDEELLAFYKNKPDIPYVMEEFVTGDICSYDGICDNEGNMLFESMNVFPPSIMDIVLNNLDLSYYTCDYVDPALQKLGRATVKAFGVKSRFVHFEFFRLTKAKEGLGKVGDYVGLEVNMRPAGGYTPDMMDYAHSVDVYQIYADMVTDNARLMPPAKKEMFCAYASRRDNVAYVHSDTEVYAKYGSVIRMAEHLPEMMRPQMGDRIFMARLETLEETLEYIAYVEERA